MILALYKTGWISVQTNLLAGYVEAKIK